MVAMVDDDLAAGWDCTCETTSPKVCPIHADDPIAMRFALALVKGWPDA
jgi:hypothetical protein